MTDLGASVIARLKLKSKEIGRQTIYTLLLRQWLIIARVGTAVSCLPSMFSRIQFRRRSPAAPWRECPLRYILSTQQGAYLVIATWFEYIGYQIRISFKTYLFTQIITFSEEYSRIHKCPRNYTISINVVVNG